MNQPAPHAESVAPAPRSNSPSEKRPLPKGRAGRKNRRDPFRPTHTARVLPTADTVELLRIVDGHRLIDSRQLQLVALGSGNARHFLDRLERLSDQEYLHRPPAQKRPGARRRPMIYALGVRGRQLLDGLDHVQRTGRRDWRLENNRLKFDFLDHEIAVTETVLALHIAAQYDGWHFVWWRYPRYHSEGVLPERVPIHVVHGDFEPLPLCPDAYLQLRRVAGAGRDTPPLHILLEVDRGTEPQIPTNNFRRASIAQKMLTYWNFLIAQAQAPGPRQSWRVLFVTTSEPRLQNMRRAAQQFVDPKHKGTHAFLLTTLDRCHIDLEQPLRVFEDHLWWSTKIGYENPRRLFLDTCPKCHQLIDTANEAYELLKCSPDDDPLYAHTSCPGHR